MTIYATGNPVGSTNPKDLIDNAQNLDYLILGPLLSYPDRIGVSRLSWAGIEASFAAAQTAKQVAFDDAQELRTSEFAAWLVASTFEIPVDYAAGIVLTRPTQVLRYLGEMYRAKQANLPMTTTAWATDSPKLLAMGDAALRQSLALKPVSGNLPNVDFSHLVDAPTLDPRAYPYNLKVDGTDSGTALQAIVASGRSFFFDPSWNIGSSVGITFAGNARVIDFNGATITQLAAHGAPVITLQGDFAGVKNLKIGGIAGGANAIRTTGFRNSVEFVDASGYYTEEVLYIDGLETRVMQSKFRGGLRGILVNKSDAWFANTYVEQNRQEGVRANAGTISAYHLHSFGNGTKGFYCVGSAFSNWIDCYADTNGEDSWYFFNSSGNKVYGGWGFKGGQKNIVPATGTYYEWMEAGASANNKYISCDASHGSSPLYTAFSWRLAQGSIAFMCAADHEPYTDVSGSRLSNGEYLECTGSLALFSRRQGAYQWRASIPAGGSVTFNAFLRKDILNNLGLNNIAVFSVKCVGRMSDSPSSGVLTFLYPQVQNGSTSTATVKQHLGGADVLSVTAVAATDKGVDVTIANSHATSAVGLTVVIELIADSRSLI
jgi:hypothetical protein